MKEKEMKEKKIISMADANLLESNYLHLLRLTFSTDIKRSDYIKSVARYTAWFRLVQCVVPINFSRQSPPGTYLCVEYGFQIWSVVLTIYLEILDKIQRSVCNVIDTRLQ